MANQPSKSGQASDRAVYREFGQSTSNDALQRAVPDLAPNQQQVRVETSRAGRKGKTVTLARGFQSSPDTLTALVKQLKSQCGSGGTVKDNVIEIQGDHKQKVLDFLVKLGYKAKASGG